MAMTMIEIINAALLKLGAFKISALNDGSTEAEIASALYSPARDALLSLYPWGFAVAQASISTTVSAPAADYTYAYALPADHLRTLSVGNASSDGPGTGSGVRFRQQNNRIETDATPIILTYLRRVTEADQPPYFTAALIARLAAEFCMPITENAARTEVLYRLADLEVTRARTVDSQQDTPSSLRQYSLIDARG